MTKAEINTNAAKRLQLIIDAYDECISSHPAEFVSMDMALEFQRVMDETRDLLKESKEVNVLENLTSDRCPECRGLYEHSDACSQYGSGWPENDQ